MKLAAFCIAALSLTACVADEDYGSGGQLEGMRPAKPSLDDEQNNSFNPPIFEGMQLPGTNDGYVQEEPYHDGIYMERVREPSATPEVCDTCDIIARHVPGDGSVVGEEIQFFSDNRQPICRIFLDPSGGVISNDCDGRL